MSFLRFTSLWAASMAWHLTCIARGRADFARLSDSRATAVSFFAVFFFAVWLRHGLATGAGWHVVVGNWVLIPVLMLVLFERSDRSSSLVFAMLGASAAVDLVVAASYFLGAGDMLSSNAWFLAELTLQALAFIRFFSMPEAVRARGYSARSPA